MIEVYYIFYYFYYYLFLLLLLFYICSDGQPLQIKDLDDESIGVCLPWCKNLTTDVTFFSRLLMLLGIQYDYSANR